MTGRVAQALNTGHARHLPQQTRQRPRGAVWTRPVIGVDVLSNQRHLAYPGLGEQFDFANEAVDRAGKFGTARIGYDAKRAKLVAAFLYGDESANAARADCTRGWRGKRGKFVVSGKFSVDCTLTVRGASQ